MTKIIAMVTFKNEAALLGHMASSLHGLVDELVAYDDGSIDESRDVLMSTRVPVWLMPPVPTPPWQDGGQWQIRRAMLKEARRRGGTHFVFLDADEAISISFQEQGRSYIERMLPGETLVLPWWCPWRSIDRVPGSRSPWSGRKKDFVIADAPGMDFRGDDLMHFTRTPQLSRRFSPVQAPSPDWGVVHFQFVWWQHALEKQAWKMMAEMRRGDRSAGLINWRYRNSVSRRERGVLRLSASQMPASLPQEAPVNTILLDEIFHWLNEDGIERYEKLNIWQAPSLLDYYIGKVGVAPPRPAIGLSWSEVKKVTWRRLARKWSEVAKNLGLSSAT